MTTTADSLAVGVAIGPYSGSRGCKNALLIAINPATYAESHQLKSYSLSDFSGATSVIKSTDKYGMTYYNGFWSKAEKRRNMHLIFNLDTLEAIDFRNPNWFYGDASRAFYKACGSPLRGDFEVQHKMGTISTEK